MRRENIKHRAKCNRYLHSGGTPSIETFLQEVTKGNSSNWEASEEEKTRREKTFFVRGITNALRGRVIFHDVIPDITRTESEEYIKSMLGTTYKGGLFVLTWHSDHLHIVHDCSYSGQQCRCARLLGIPIKKSNRRMLWRHTITDQYWFNLANYFLQPPRELVHFEVGQTKRILPSSFGSVSGERITERREAELVEAFAFEECLSDQFSDGSVTTESGRSNSASHETTQRKRRNAKGSKEESLLQFLRECPTCPLLNITQTNIWYQSQFKFMKRNDPMIQVCIDALTNELIDKTITDLYNYLTGVTPLFSAVRGNLDEYYYSIEESLNILDNLLLYQCNNSGEQVSIFLNALFSISNKTASKCNTLFVLGPPASGKNFFFDSYVNFFISVGYIGNFNKYCNFPLQDCVNKRILMWNEPNIECGAWDTLKMLLGGDPLNVKVKYQMDVCLYKTPIIMLSNRNIIPNGEAFRQRVYRVQWSHAPFLIEYNKKPHPLAYFHLFHKYNVIKDDLYTLIDLLEI